MCIQFQLDSSFLLLIFFRKVYFCSFCTQPEFTSYKYKFNLNQTIIKNFTYSPQKVNHSIIILRHKMDLFRRIGTQKKKFKVQFFIGRLKFSSYRAGKIYIVIKRGDHKVKSQQKLQMSQDCKLNFNKQILQIEATLYFDEKEKIYQQKTGQLSVVLLDEKDNKVLLGDLVFDIAAYANSGQESIKENKKLQNSPKKIQGRIEFNVFVKYIGEGSQSSADKVSDFFFGKHKDENEATNGKDKTKRNESKKKTQKQPEQTKKNKAKIVPQSQSEQSYEAESNSKQKQKPKGLSKVEQQKSKVQQKNLSKQQPANNRPQSLSKNLVVPSNKNNNNNQKAYLTSDNEDENSKQPFYFDQPYAKDPKEKNKKVSQIKKNSQVEKPTKMGSKAMQSVQAMGKQKIVQNSQQEGSEGEHDIAMSEVQRVDVGNMFSKSQMQQVTRNKPLVKSQVTSLKDEPIPVKIRDKSVEKFLAKENSIKQSSKKSQQNGKKQQQKRRMEQKEQQNKQKQRKSIDKRKEIKPQEYKKQKEAAKVQKKKENGNESQEQQFEFGKQMSRDWLQKNQATQNHQSDREYEFVQKSQPVKQPSTAKQSKSKIRYSKQTRGKQVQSKQKQLKPRQQSPNKFKKSIIEELMPPYSDKEKEKQQQYQQSKHSNAFEEYSEQQQQQQQTHKQKTTSTNNNNNNNISNQSYASKDYQKLAQQNLLLKQLLSAKQSTIKQLQSKIHQFQQSLQEMSQQVNYYQSQLKIKEQELEEQRNHTSKTMRSFSEEKGSVEKLEKELRAVEKLKNQLVVENSKLKEKYRKDFAQYEQLLEEKETQAINSINKLKADILKFKDQNSTLRAQGQKITNEFSLKSQENNKIKQQVSQLQKELNEVKEALSNLKFKISLATGQSAAIQLLMELNKH